MAQLSNEKFILDHVKKRVESGYFNEAESVVNDIKKRYKISFEYAKEIFKNAILNFVCDDLEKQGHEFIGSIKSKDNIFTMPDLSIATEFFKEAWRKYPFTMPQKDFNYMQQCLKKPLKCSFYDTNRPIYNFVDKDKLHSNFKMINLLNKKIVLNTQFYLADDKKQGQSLYAKQMEFCFTPKKFRKKDNAEVDDFKSEIEKLTNEEFYNRTLSISMFSLLDGNPNKAMSVMRYDNQYDFNNYHKNTYIGKEKRYDIFGAKAEYPHFHFQSEDDSLFCLQQKKHSSKNSVSNYRVSKCNAIDCKHLKKYLIIIDGLSGSHLKNERDNNGSYGMPFLSMKEEKHKVYIDIEKIIEEYKSENQIKNEKGIFLKINEWIENSKQKDEYKDNEFKCFAQLIKAIDFLREINFLRKRVCEIDSSNDLKFLSELEILIANKTMDVVSRISKTFVKKIEDGKEDDLYIY